MTTALAHHLNGAQSRRAILSLSHAVPEYREERNYHTLYGKYRAGFGRRHRYGEEEEIRTLLSWKPIARPQTSVEPGGFSRIDGAVSP